MQGDSDWETRAVLKLKPDGDSEFQGPAELIKDTTAEFGINTSIIQPFWNPELEPVAGSGFEKGRFVSMKDGELFLKTLVNYARNAYQQWEEVEEP